MRRVALGRLGAVPGARPVVLDVGCGAGGFLSDLERRRPAARCFGADSSGEALALARSGLSSRSIRLLRASAAELPVAASSADALVLHDVLQHLPPGDDARALSEAHRVLRPGGLLSLRTNIGSSTSASTSSELGSASLHRRYAPAAIARLVGSAGFEIEAHLVLHPLAALLGRFRRSNPANSNSHSAPAGELAMTVPSAFVNRAMDLYSRVEDAVVARLPVSATGDAQLLFARKPLQVASK
ncbi:MAG: class I SAM-dependent methyltransferase [Acidobacteriota bacterium]